jgi:hypothetical protein
VAARTDRLNAAKRIDLAHRSSDPEVKLALLDMAQYWLTLAEQTVKKNETVLAYETPKSHHDAEYVVRYSKFGCSTSEVGHFRTKFDVRIRSAYPSIADSWQTSQHVGVGP